MKRTLAIFLALAFAPDVRAEPLTYTMMRDAIVAADPTTPQPPTIGAGRYSYRFTLRDPHTGLPWPRQAYALSLTRAERHKLPFVAEDKGVYQGTTDDAGRTSIFRLPFRVADQHWDFRERFGEGPYGETFKLVTPDPEQPLADMPYVISICSTPVQTFHGYSHADGKTGYAASRRPEHLELREGVDATDSPPDACGQSTLVAAAEQEATVLPPEFPAKGRIQAILYAGETALKAHDYVTAHAHFAQADAMFRDHAAELQSPGSLMGHAEIKYYAALATGGGKLGDPCPELADARQLAETARGQGKASSEADVLAIANDFLGDIDKQAALYKCTAAPAVGAPRSLVGHYYLSGIHEVGSELLLKPDARFEWMLAYGSMDQSASGTWWVDGATLILTTDRADPSAPLAVLGPFIPWEVEAENALRRRTLGAAQDAVAAQCPLLAMPDSVVSTPRSYRSEAERDAAKATAAKEIGPAAARESVARSGLETTAAAAMSATSDNAAMARANAALAAWQTADADLYDVYDRAGLQRPRRETPRLPDACNMPSFIEADSENKIGWTSGLGIQLRFADDELSAAPLDVTFHFGGAAADVKVESDRDGYAFLPAASAQAWTQVLLAIRTPNGMKIVTLPVSPPQSTGIQTILLNAKALAPPPFDTMRLTIGANDLTPEGQLARGTYSRQ